MMRDRLLRTASKYKEAIRQSWEKEDPEAFLTTELKLDETEAKAIRELRIGDVAQYALVLAAASEHRDIIWQSLEEKDPVAFLKGKLEVDEAVAKAIGKLRVGQLKALNGQERT